NCHEDDGAADARQVVFSHDSNADVTFARVRHWSRGRGCFWKVHYTREFPRSARLSMEYPHHLALTSADLALRAALRSGEVRAFKRPICGNLQVLYFHVAAKHLVVALARLPAFVVGVDHRFAHLRWSARLDSHCIVVPQVRQLVRLV